MQLEGYLSLEGGCSSGDYIGKYNDISVQECALFCDSNSQCVGFEYQVDYGTGSDNCTLSSNLLNDCAESDELLIYVKSGISWNMIYVGIRLKTFCGMVRRIMRLA